MPDSTSRHDPNRYGRRVPMSMIGLMVVAMVSLEAGTALAKTLFAVAGVVFVTFLRNFYSALLLWSVTRPRLRTYRRRQWRDAGLLGVVMAGMNLTLYAAAARIPLGVAVAIAFVGPITVALIGGRGQRKHRGQWVWPLVAYAGVLLFTPAVSGVSASAGSLDPVGLLIAGVNALGWALYIVLTARLGASFSRLDGLTLATAISAVVLAPAAVVAAATGDGDGFVQPRVLALGLVMAAAASAIPYACDYTVLRRGMPKVTYSILLSLEPVIAAVIGLVAIDQRLTGIQCIAIALIVCASAAAARNPSMPTTRDAADRAIGTSPTVPGQP